MVGVRTEEEGQNRPEVEGDGGEELALAAAMWPCARDTES